MKGVEAKPAYEFPEQNYRWAEATTGARHGGGALTTIILQWTRLPAARRASTRRRLAAGQ